MGELDAGSVDAIVTDPPYGLGFMGREWDSLPPGVPWARECLRVLKPGGHLLAFGGTRTYHRLACAIEDAGFEIRDCIAWLYGSGFPKSLDVSKAIDAQAGAVREVVGPGRWNHVKGDNARQADCLIRPGGQHAETAPATPDAERWQGWGTALKPAHEPVVVARKPLAGTVAATVLAHGTGALNVDGCRIGETVETWPKSRSFAAGISPGYTDGIERGATQATGDVPAGRWPANVVLDPEAAAMLDEQTGELHAGGTTRDGRGAIFGSADGQDASAQRATFNDPGGASRFYYVAKASSAERNAGLDGFEAKPAGNFEDDAYEWATDGRGNPRSAPIAKRNVHPTVKPIDLMRWLVRLVTPPGGLVLDPFTGSGTTGCAAVLEGFRFLGIEREDEYAAIAEARIKWWAAQPPGCDVDAALEANAKRGKVEATGQMTIV